MRKLLAGLVVIGAIVVGAAPAQAAPPQPWPPHSEWYTHTNGNQLSRWEAMNTLVGKSGVFPYLNQACPAYFWWGSAGFDGTERFNLFGYGCLGPNVHGVSSTSSYRIDNNSMQQWVYVYAPSVRVYCQYYGRVHSVYVNGTEQFTVDNNPHIDGCWGY